MDRTRTVAALLRDTNWAERLGGHGLARSLLVWWLRGDTVRQEDLSAREQLDFVARQVRTRRWTRRLGGAVGLGVLVWLVANPGLRYCRHRWPQGTSEVLHGAWALVTSPGFGAVGAVIAALVAFMGALRSQARSASKDRWWETFEWVMTNRLTEDGSGTGNAAEWFGYLKGTATSPDESVIINVLTQEARRREQGDR
ncbi:hypothetical protein [Tsukamurella pseudospumae]|uniref:hypothetical protein n=1 Tax=Tsukamurella pseudospumae TaxID=239498 RepID=UPI0012E74202|nr:hypothetical protein [Tsukamurella pseudospumae]